MSRDVKPRQKQHTIWIWGSDVSVAVALSVLSSQRNATTAAVARGLACARLARSVKIILSSSLRVFSLISCTKMVRKSDRVKIPTSRDVNSILLRGTVKGGEGGRPKDGEAAAAVVKRRQRRRKRRESSDRNSTLSDGLCLCVRACACACVWLCVLVFASLIFVVFCFVYFCHFKIIYLKLYPYTCVCRRLVVSVCVMPCQLLLRRKVQKCSSKSASSVALKLYVRYSAW